MFNLMLLILIIYKIFKFFTIQTNLRKITIKIQIIKYSCKNKKPLNFKSNFMRENL